MTVRSLALGTAAAVILLPAPAQARVPAGNLLANPGAEAGAGAPDASTIIAPPSWTTTGELTAVRYGASGFPTTAQSAQIGGGTNFFGGGNAATSTGEQVVNVSVAQPEIDTGRVGSALSAFLGGFASQTDNTRIAAVFLAANGATLGSHAIGPVTAADRGNQTALLPRGTSGPLPACTRSIKVVITGTRLEGTYNDAYADNVSLTLNGSAAPGTAPTARCASTVAPPVLARTVNVQPAGGKVFVSVPAGGAFASVSVPGIKGRRFVALTAARQIPVGSFLDTRRGTVSLTSASSRAGQVFSGSFSAGVFQALQSRSGLTTMSLKGSSFRSCAARSGRRATAALSRRVIRRMRGNASGRYRTRGRYSAATVRGTIWDTVDRCDGTLTKVTRGTVVVRDFRKRRNIVVRAGKSYLARAPG
jgi:hypothetical protein